MRRTLFGLGALALVAGCATENGGTGILLNEQGTTITATKSADGRLTKTFVWTLEKTAATDTVRLFRGDDAAVTFTLAAARTDSVNVVSVAGEVCVTNGGSEETTGLEIVDQVQAQNGDGEWEDVSDASLVIAPEEQIAAGTETCYPYEIPFTPVDGAAHRNTATITITNLTGSEGSAAGLTVTEGFDIATDITGEAARTITVDDTYGERFTFDTTGTTTYDHVFACDADAGDNVNTATIAETGVTAEAKVVLDCYALDVAKTAETDYTATWAWSLDKTSDTTALLLPAGFPFDVTYDVTPTAEAVKGDATVTGTITITNPAPFDAVVTEVVDTAESGLPLAVTCTDVTFPATLAPDASIACTYAGDLPDAEPRVNVATAVLQNTSYDAAGAGTAGGTTGFTGSTTMTFDGEPSAEYDTCIDVTDEAAGDLGTICVGDLPTTLTYASTWGPYETCGDFQAVNTASFVTNDTEATGEASWTVNVTVPCGPNCTLGHGYWKNHSEYGPAKYDPAWALLAAGADQPFFGSGYSWLTIMRVPSRGGDAYIILGRQYAAAWLNGLRGANVSAVADELQRAADLLDQYDADPSMVTGEVRKEFLQLAGTLDDFNSGKIGPGSCSDDSGDGDGS